VSRLVSRIALMRHAIETPRLCVQLLLRSASTPAPGTKFTSSLMPSGSSEQHVVVARRPRALHWPANDGRVHLREESTAPIHAFPGPGTQTEVVQADTLLDEAFAGQRRITGFDPGLCVRWAREFWQAMQPYATGGVYVNYLGQEADEGADRVKAAYGPEKYQKLVALKTKYDPTNMFRLNQNVRPG
jgi:hypothetical protein